MESHAVLIVGFDDETKTFDVVDPWNHQFGGNQHGRYRISYEELALLHVNATMSKVMRPAPLDYTVNSLIDENRNSCLLLSFGYYAPKGYIIDELSNMFTEFNILVSYTIDEKKQEYSSSIKGEWPAGELAKIIIPVGNQVLGDIHFQFQIIAVVTGQRPYPYKDTLHVSFSETIHVTHTNTIPHDSKESILSYLG